MERDRSLMTKKILDLTLEIIYLLTGEAYTLVKKTSSDHVTPSSHLHALEGWIRKQSHILGPPPPICIPDRNNDKKILEITNKITELLVGEVPIRCQDVTVCLSKEKENCLEGQKNVYIDIVMKNQSLLTSPDRSSRNPPERCKGPLQSQGSALEDQKGSQDSWDENPIHVKVEVKEEAEEACVRDDELCKEEEIPIEISTDGQYIRKRPDRHPIDSPYCKIEDDDDVTSDSSEENPITANLRQTPPSADLLPDLSTHGDSFPDHAPPVIHHTGQRGGETFLCSECGECFAQWEELISHRKDHIVEKPFSCSECGKCFTRRWNLAKHQRTHSGEKPYSCSDCGKSFSQRSTLTTHQKTHSGEKPYACSVCGKSFTLRSSLISHQVVHTGARPHSCSECGKCFGRRWELAVHQRTHSGEKPYSCSECGRCFSQRSTLITHQITHKGENPYSCSKCGQCFIKRLDFDNHQKSHSAEKPVLT
ncbi:oocyte zinc finger protein XlCOF8.4-like [Hyperolius riggenbachi]|uniref:oocyte zinc finger protein XlCOF8.4-like n=1 Tax=Hyperolius riggenbachi TaxID=752182 RepID=UPI0035A3447B